MQNNINEEPEWLNLENDRKTPFSDEEIESFVNDFIGQFPDHYNELLKKYSPDTAREIIRESFKNRDSNRQKPDYN
jgi:hypothetical protein